MFDKPCVWKLSRCLSEHDVRVCLDFFLSSFADVANDLGILAEEVVLDPLDHHFDWFVLLEVHGLELFFGDPLLEGVCDPSHAVDQLKALLLFFLLLVVELDGAMFGEMNGFIDRLGWPDELVAETVWSWRWLSLSLLYE